MTRRHSDAFVALLGSALVLAALTLIWVARLSVARNVYVSELGATGQPTARVFEVALLLVVGGGSLIAFGSRDIRSRIGMSGPWTPAVSLWIASGFFLVASQVTCTAGCPVPYGVSFQWQDLWHIVCAVLAFAAACVAMLQVSFVRDHARLAIFSRVCGVAVAVIATTGGLLSLADLWTGFGGGLELVATTIAIGWLATYGGVTGAAGTGTARV
jgi:hypothetical protein